MPKSPERANIEFNPPLAIRTPSFERAEEILREMGIRQSVAIFYVGNHEIREMSFESRDQAVMFRLRL